MGDNRKVTDLFEALTKMVASNLDVLVAELDKVWSTDLQARLFLGSQVGVIKAAAMRVKLLQDGQPENGKSPESTQKSQE